MKEFPIGDSRFKIRINWRLEKVLRTTDDCFSLGPSLPL